MCLWKGCEAILTVSGAAVNQIIDEWVVSYPSKQGHLGLFQDFTDPEHVTITVATSADCVPTIRLTVVMETDWSRYIRITVAPSKVLIPFIH